MTKTLSTKKQIFKVKDLHPAEYNPRTIKKEALSGLEKSLDKFGYLQHIVVNTRDGKNTIISGHQRIKALALSGNEKIECIVVDFDGITEKAANVALNAESISGNWVLEDLEEILFELQAELPDDEFDELNYDDLAEELDIELDEIDKLNTDLPEGDKPGIRTATFTFSEEQYQLIDSLIREEIRNNPVLDDPAGINENKHGNALYEICRKVS